jgi:hypothetical protein
MRSIDDDQERPTDDSVISFFTLVLAYQILYKAADI